MRSFFEEMFFAPKYYHYLFIVVLFPLSLLYGFFMFVRRKFTVKKSFGIAIVSVGNLIVGGAGKTPFVIALASRFQSVSIISRGYGRMSTGLIEVSHNGKILVEVEESGDEAMEMAMALKGASVIVSENRHLAIKLAKSRGAKLIILDDGFNRVDIEKFEILLEPEKIYNYLPFPSGAFREFYFAKNDADIVLKEGFDFKRMVEFQNLSECMLLVTAISNPQRLDKYLPKGVVAKVYLDDHAYFDEKLLTVDMTKHNAKSLLVTQKDAVKMKAFKLPLSKMKLKLQINNEIFTKVEDYIEGYTNER